MVARSRESALENVGGCLAQSDTGRPFAIKFIGPRGAVSDILADRPKAFDWRYRAAKRHPWRQVPAQLFAPLARH
jgi:mRNA interferase MazF